MTEREERIISIEQAIKNGKRITGKEAWHLMCEATHKGEELCMIWKIPNSIYQDWYDKLVNQLKSHNEQVLTTLEDETTYIVHSGAKAFDSSKGGYSIFAESLGSMKRDDFFALDRIEHYKCEWAIIYSEGK